MDAWSQLTLTLPARHAAAHAAAGPGWLGVLLIGLTVTVLLFGALGSALHRALGRRLMVTLVVLGIPVLLVLAGGGIYLLDHAWHAAWTHLDWLVGLAAVVILITGVGRRLVFRLRHGRRRSRISMAHRVRWRMHPGPGFAGAWTLRRRYSAAAARKAARHARPSLSWLQRHLPGSWRQYAALNGWAAEGLLRRRAVYSSLESMRLIIAPPQSGKTAAAAGTILDAPGPVVATSIRGDLLEATATLRGRAGRLNIWNPEGVGNHASTFGWNPVEGCQDMVTAVRRAGYMIEANSARGLSDEGFWKDQASLVLASYLHAAALAGADLTHVHRWVLEEDNQPVRILARHPGAAPQALSQATQYLALPGRTRAGISATINATLKFMQHPAVVRAVSPAAGEGFDFAGFLADRNTLYLVADDATSPVAPLFVALAAELTWVARQAGGTRRPARPPRDQLLGSKALARLAPQPRTVARLDPPLSLVLDEVANIAPVPVAAWATWAAGSGVWLHLYAQAWAQLAERWGDHGAAVIWQSCRTKVIFAGTSENKLCQMAEDACGKVRLRGIDDWRYTRTGKPRRRPSFEDVPVLPHSDLIQLPEGHAVVIQGSAKPTIVRTEQFWHRRDVKMARRHHGPISLPVPEPREIPDPMPDLLSPPDPAGEEPVSSLAPGWGPSGVDESNWALHTARIPRELFQAPQPPEPAAPPQQQQPHRPPRPPTRRAPWEPSATPGGDHDDAQRG
jgi:type IV secretion system protein VirD4